jgi:alpha-ketoglutarate-dependent taurine dioxygenase
MINLKPYLKELFEHGYVEISQGIDWHPQHMVDSIKSITSTMTTYEKSIVPGFPEIVCFKPGGNLDIMELDWHQDNSYFKNKAWGAMLFNYNQGEKVLPTWFVDTNKVIQDLDEDFKNILKNSKATWNFLTHLSSLTPEQKTSSYSERYIKLIERGLLSNTSNVLIEHPVSGKEIIWLSPATISKTDLSQDHINYLNKLFDKHAFPLYWKPKQLIMFDNIRMMHKRDALDPVIHATRELRAIRFNYLESLPLLDSTNILEEGPIASTKKSI